jgi:hypothetical protein
MLNDTKRGPGGLNKFEFYLGVGPRGEGGYTISLISLYENNDISLLIE